MGMRPLKAPGGSSIHYERRRLELTTLYRLVQQHAATFFAQAELNIIAAILELGSDTKGPEDRLCLAHARASVPRQAIEKILKHLGREARAPPRSPARG
jgi:hypothetical protein